MSRREREKKLRRIREKETQQLKILPWQKRAPFWLLFLYRFGISFLIILPLALVIIYFVLTNKSPEESAKNTTAIMKTDFGNITFTLYEQDAPKTVENFVKLAKKGYYNGLPFHRVINEFMIQAGDPNCLAPTEVKQCGAGGESIWRQPFPDEINAKSLGLSDEQIKSLTSEGYKYRADLKSHKIEIGSVAMANAGPNTNGSQFFIVTQKPQPHLNGKHTAFGMVEQGMEVVSAIAAVEVDENDRPVEEVKIKEVKVVSRK